jgi:hypothetical protein
MPSARVAAASIPARSPCAYPFVKASRSMADVSSGSVDAAALAGAPTEIEACTGLAVVGSHENG